MSAADRLRALACVALIVTGALAGCSDTTAGRPEGNAGDPTEPSFPTAQPSRSSPPPTTSRSSPSPSPSPTTGAEPLPDENGWSFVETKSGKTRCQLSRTEVGCEAPFTDSPVIDGVQANGIRLTADGQFEWLVGNLGDPPVVTLDYKEYAAQGWTIEASEAGTRFTNDATGHGMFVALERVETF